MSDITSLSAVALSSAIHQHEVSCVEVMSGYLQRIQHYNPYYNCIVSLADPDLLIAQAQIADEELAAGNSRGWMHGFPYAAKDLIDVAGFPTTWGSPLFADNIAREDDPLVAGIRAAGAIMVGKTNTPEFGLGSHTYNPVFGVTSNPYDSELTAGGSSGGAGCALAAQMLPVAEGSDMMGSLRNPAAFNNVIGFRPSVGRVPGADLHHLRLATLGPMGRNSRDCFALLNTLATTGTGRPYDFENALPDVSQLGPRELKGVRIGWLGDHQSALAMEPGILSLCVTALSGLTDHGVDVEACSLGFDLAKIWESWMTLRHWSRIDSRPLFDDPNKRAHLKPELLWEIESSRQLTAEQLFSANAIRANWFRHLNSLFDHYDFLLAPSAQVFPFNKAEQWPAEVNGREMDTYHRWMEVVVPGSLAGTPVCNVPVGFDAKGRPMGMQIMGRYGQDQAVMEMAMAYEEITDHLSVRPLLKEPSA